MVLIDGFVRTEVRFKYIADGQACFEQFGTDVLLCYPMDQYGRTWSLDGGCREGSDKRDPNTIERIWCDAHNEDPDDRR